jgi:hypothetical protein
MQNDEIKFPTPICSDTAPHAKHRIAGTWRAECPGVEGDDSAAKPGPRVDIAELDAKVVHDALPAHLVGDVSGKHYVKPVKDAPDDICPDCGGDCLHPAEHGFQRNQERRPERNKCVHGFWIQGGIETCPDGCTKTLADEAEQWIAEQVGQLSETELLMLKGVLDDIAAGRPVEHFEAGTRVYANTWGETEFIVQGTAAWHENGVVSRKVEIRSASGNLTGHVAPGELRRVS